MDNVNTLQKYDSIYILWGFLFAIFVIYFTDTYVITLHNKFFVVTISWLTDFFKKETGIL